MVYNPKFLSSTSQWFLVFFKKLTECPDPEISQAAFQMICGTSSPSPPDNWIYHLFADNQPRKYTSYLINEYHCGHLQSTPLGKLYANTNPYSTLQSNFGTLILKWPSWQCISLNVLHAIKMSSSKFFDLKRNAVMSGEHGGWSTTVIHFLANNSI